MAFNQVTPFKSTAVKSSPTGKPPSKFMFGSLRATKPEPAQKVLKHEFDVPQKLGDYFK